MVRLTTISNVLSGVGLTILAVSAGVKLLLLTADVEFTSSLWRLPYYLWLASVVILGLVLLMSIINTFTELTGFVHPEDKLLSNMFVYIFAIGAVLILGYINEYPDLQELLFNVASMIVIAYVFLFIFVVFSSTITEGSEIGAVKEMTARFMIVSLLLGGVMAGLLIGFRFVWDFFNSYVHAAATLGLSAVVLAVLIVLFLSRKYEPVGE